jgi:hypothetical protein
MFRNCEAFKHEVHVFIISLVYQLYYGEIKFLADVRILPEHVQIIRSNIGPESVEQCRDVQNEPI